MSLPTIFQIESFGDIRMTDDFRFSVFDVIRVVGGQKNPHDVWKRLTETYPEVLAETENFKFAGKGQRDTPVMGRKGLLVLIGLIPGHVGAKYRELAAQTVHDLLDDPAQLAKAAINRVTDKEEVADVAKVALEKYITTYHPLFDTIKAATLSPKHPKGNIASYIHANTTNTVTVLGAEPHEIVEVRGGKNARSNCSSNELIHFAMLQELEESAIRTSNAKGYMQVAVKINEVADDFKSLMVKYGV